MKKVKAKSYQAYQALLFMNYIGGDGDEISIQIESYPNEEYFLKELCEYYERNKAIPSKKMMFKISRKIKFSISSSKHFFADGFLKSNLIFDENLEEFE